MVKNKEELKPIGSFCISNNMAIVIYDIIYGIDDSILAGYNDKKPRKYRLYYNSKGAYFNFGKIRVYMDRVMRL